MKSKILFFVFIFFSKIVIASEQAPLKREIRAVWLTTNYALDWPKTPFKTFDDIDKQKKDLLDILHSLKKANFNMIFFQTRFGGSVIYNSKIELMNPIIKDLRSKITYDPLSFAIKECHKLGLECHVWLVTYNLGIANNGIKVCYMLDGIGNRVKLKIYKYNGIVYLDPGEPSTSRYIISIVKEIVKKYDVDGIHMDYIRYPEITDEFPDDVTYRRYAKGEDKITWRKNNINHFVSELYHTVKKIKSWVQVSSAVVGIYDRISHIDNKYYTAHEVCQDPEQWLRTGVHDFIVPMMYYSNDLFFQIIQDWKMRKHGRFIVPGLGIYKMKEKNINWEPSIITEQISYSRFNNMSGNAFFRVSHLVSNVKGILDEIKNNFYSYPALLPSLVWLKKSSPISPKNLRLIVMNNFILLSWDRINSFEKENVFYNVYQIKHEEAGINDASNLLAARIIGSTFSIPIDSLKLGDCYYAVTSYDRYHNESKMSKMVHFQKSK